MMKILLAVMSLLLIPLSNAFGDSIQEIELSYSEYKPGFTSPRTMQHDFSKIDFEVLEVQKFFIPKWIDEPGDFSDILQVKFNVTNNGLEHFVVYKDMFQIDVIDPREQYQEVRRTNQDYMVDNYYPQYIEDFKLRFQDITLPQSLFECELLSHSLQINQTRTLSVCFDIKQKWSNHPLDLNGPRLYFLVMMDNKSSSSCPNCKSALLNEYYENLVTKLGISSKGQILGVPIDEISCKEELFLVYKKSGKPACVKPSSVEKLIERGWIAMEPTQKMKMSPEKLFFTLQGDDQVGSLNNANLDAGPMMTYISSNNDGSLILATSSGSDTVYAFDSFQEKLVTTIPVGETPKGVKIHPEGNIAFVANEGSGTISVIDTESWIVTKEIIVGKIPHNIRFDSQGNMAYVTLQGEDKIAIIDVNNLEMIDSISVEKLPHNLDLSPDDRYLYTANIGTNDVAVIDLESKEIIKKIKVSTGHHGIDVSNDGNRIYVSGIGSEMVNVIDTESLELIKQIEVGEGPHGIRASVDDSKFYVGVTKTNEILVIDTNTLTVKDKIQVDNVPFWLAIPGNP